MKLQFFLLLLLVMINVAADARYFVPPVDNRAFWEQYRNPGGYLGTIVERARKICGEGAPPAPRPDDYFRKSHVRGASGSYEAQYNAFHNALREVLMAFCLTGDRETFLPVLENMLNAVCAMPGWSVPAFDPAGRDQRGQAFNLDLYSTSLAGTLGAAAWLLRPALKPELHARLTVEIDRRILMPFEAQLKRPKGKRMGWIDQPGNWNAVCLAGITVAAATTVDDPVRRNAIFEAARTCSRSYLDGFTADGYTSEGVDYWNYGFGHYLLLADLLKRASGGPIDLLAEPKAQAAAGFPDQIRISETIYPSYSDAMVYSRCSPQLLNWRDWQLGRYDAATPRSLKVLQGHLMVTPDGNAKVPPLALRSSFPEAGIYNFRPGGSAARLAMSCKGGHNDEGHNHNDVGSYIIVLDGVVPVVCDPGAEVYTERTFSKRRYEGKLLNSYGHSVPVAAGCLQSTGPGARAILLKYESGEEQERLLWDLTAAYPEAKSLRKLTRLVEYRRAGQGNTGITDEAEFSVPSAFESAVVTSGKITGSGGNWMIEYRGHKLNVRISCGGEAFTCSIEELQEESRSKEQVRRLAVRLDKPVLQGEIKVEYFPEPSSR